ncbi:hypothetical protein GCM10009839_56460 [Catenulispora yoronensis]|uniref:Uncharacterized protein n=1 Tax=Catenulispora yoronensis TaxID=450799 RepID=A0ABP5GII4_9ACTN
MLRFWKCSPGRSGEVGAGVPEWSWPACGSTPAAAAAALEAAESAGAPASVEAGFAGLEEQAATTIISADAQAAPTSSRRSDFRFLMTRRRWCGWTPCSTGDAKTKPRPAGKA